MKSVTFVVSSQVPPAPHEAVFITGSHELLGNWSGAGPALQCRPDGHWYTTLALPEDTLLEFKLTKGTWATVEKGPRGEELPNRVIRLTHDAVVHLTAAQWAHDRRPYASTLTGDIRFHHSVHAARLQNDRTVIVYLPPGYQTNSLARYPVLYMQDGQNIFDAATSFCGVEWQLDECAERLIANGEITPVIIVGVYNSDQRAFEYTAHRDTLRDAGGGADDYARFLMDDLKPFIDRTYRTLPGREHTAIAGSSLGGLVALYCAWRYPDTFSACAALSPALWWADAALLRAITRSPASLQRCRTWVDIGTEEGSTRAESDALLTHTRALAGLLAGHGGVPGQDYVYWEVDGAPHHERAWAARIERILLFLFGVNR
jgi:predicted alpha/beta superfamily hydrolase